MSEHCHSCEIEFFDGDEYRTDTDGCTWCERCWTNMLIANDEAILREYEEREVTDQEFKDDLDL